MHFVEHAALALTPAHVSAGATRTICLLTTGRHDTLYHTLVQTNSMSTNTACVSRALLALYLYQAVCV
jgi:hypothetical protein